ncbi:putative metalloprotease CJM1_0395 family protein, partial [Candidatus Neomarinimicrobiota bacterium]
LLPVNPFTSLIPDSTPAASWTADDSQQGNVRKVNQDDNGLRDGTSNGERGKETASTRGVAVINEIVPGRTDETNERGKPDSASSDPAASASDSTTKNLDSTDLTPEEKEQVRELREQDTRVRRHEQAHVTAGGRYIKSRAQFQFELGPDGKLYAVSGEVQIDTSKVPDDPEATVLKAQTVRRAALAPSDPSAQDRSVASEANRMEFEARMEITQQRVEESRPTDESSEEKQTNQFPAELNLLDLFV